MPVGDDDADDGGLVEADADVDDSNILWMMMSAKEKKREERPDGWAWKPALEDGYVLFEELIPGVELNLDDLDLDELDFE